MSDFKMRIVVFFDICLDYFLLLDYNETLQKIKITKEHEQRD
jgi:hypothetical protein